MAPLLSACSLLDPQSEHYLSSPHASYSSLPAPMSPMSSVEHGLPMEDFYPEAEKKLLIKEQVRERIQLGLTSAQSHALGCSIRDRFDRSAAVAYNFKDEQTRVALHLDIEGPSLSNPSRLELNKVMFRFTHHFQKPAASQKAKCLYPSGFQGLIGSAYNEFVARDNYTIWHELRDRGINLR